MSDAKASADLTAGSQTARVRADIAIVGMACRFPGARDVETFWKNIRDGVESIRSLSEEALIEAGESRAALDDPAYVRACPVLDDIDQFDAGLFGFSPRDASVTDPAHRFFLEVVYEALEHSGCSARPEDGAVGVFASSGAPYYYMDNLRTNADLMESMGEFLVRHTGNDPSFLSTRVSYEFDLRGPSINVQTACSSALVALHMAARSLRSGECDVAIAGASTILQPQGRGYFYHEGEILSPDGHCRPFDADSGGTVFGSGTAAVVLKRLEDALDEGDTIHAVIKGSAVNNDGSVKVGFLAPGVDGQVEVVRRALDEAGLGARDITYVEAHGTGTRVGDPIELTALQQAFDESTDERGFCAIGSVKSNVGHLGEAAACASLIKAVLALKHRELPPTLGFSRPNEQFDMAGSSFFVNAERRPWKRQDGKPLRCGITALGAGGTNCHVILEEAPEPLEGEGARCHQLIQLSANTAAALDRMSDRLATALAATGAPDLADVAYTLAVGRRNHGHRRTVVAHTAAQAAQRLASRDRKYVQSGVAEASHPSLVFMFPGGGAQYASMGAQLYEREAVYREAVDACLDIVNPVIGRDLRQLMFPGSDALENATRALEQPTLTLPSLFSTSYALAQLFMSWGMEPEALIGHSMGEYVAACLAGVLTLQDALSLVMLRGRLFEATTRGGMVAVSLPEQEARELMPSTLGIAAVNSPQLCVASGPVAEIRAFESTLRGRDVDFTHVHIDVAAHSMLLDPILEEFRRGCRSVALSPPTIPLVSNLTGTWIEDAQATDPEYWVKQLRNTVRFADGLETLLSTGPRALVEVGPGRTLSTLARAQTQRPRLAANSMRHPSEQADDLQYALQTLGKVWMAGCDIDPHALYADQLRNKVPLPTYPFDHQSFWVQPGKAAAREDASRALTKREDMDDWFHGLSWVQQPLSSAAQDVAGSTWLVFEDGWGLGKKLRAALGGPTVIRVVPGDELTQLADHRWKVAPDSLSQMRGLLERLARDGMLPSHIVYMWSLTPGRRQGAKLQALLPGRTRVDPGQATVVNFHALVNIGCAIGEFEESVQLSVVTNDSVQLLDEWLDPFKALQHGPVRVIPREFPLVRTRCIDIRAEAAVVGMGAAVLDQLARELRACTADPIVALRAGQRLVRRVLPMPLAPADTPRRWLRAGGVYVITGGLGGIGLEVAQSLASTPGIRLALLSRSQLPPEPAWDALLDGGRGDARTRERCRRVRALRAAGAQVLVVSADVGKQASLAAGLARVRDELGPIVGVIHAAGHMDDAPMQTKSTAAMEQVLEAKVRGTCNLDASIDEDLDFFILFSSIASFLGLPGQVDYTAANAFEDAFARERSLRAHGRTVVINWNAWTDVGMAVDALHAEDASSGDPCEHPALDRVRNQGDSRIYSTDFSLESHWLLSEHRIRGSHALIPGTGHLELIRGACAQAGEQGPLELSDVTFVSPFQVEAGHPARLNLKLTPAGEMTKVAVYSTSKERPHVVANVRRYPQSPPPSLDLDAVAQRCDAGELRTDDRFLDQNFVEFGPRWANIDVTRFGEGEALIELSLDARFEADLEDYPLHPALMDMATGGCQRLIADFEPARDFYVPLSYEAVRIFAPLPRHCFGHVRRLPHSVEGLAAFDIVVCDADGQVLVEVKRFTMKRVDPASVGAANLANAASGPRVRGPEGPLAAALRQAIKPQEGIDALDRVLQQPDAVQVVVSSVDPVLWAKQLDATPDSATASGTFERPGGSADYVPPRGATQTELAKIWSELLGIREVGATDDFFDLGGDSLVAVRLMRRIKKAHGVDFGIARLFEAPDIRALAMLIDGKAEPDGAGDGDADATASPTPIARLDDWGLHPVWERRRIEPPARGAGLARWLLFMDGAGVGAALQTRLRADGHRVITVRAGDTFARTGDGSYSLAPEGGRASYDALMGDLHTRGESPDHIVHLWLVTSEERFRPGSTFFHQSLQDGFYSLLHLAQALAGLPTPPTLRLTAVTSDAQAVGPDARVAHPAKAAALGALASIPRELSSVQCNAVDVQPSAAAHDAHALVLEAQSAPPDEVAALRADGRHVRRFRPWPLRAGQGGGLRSGGHYVITGAFSGGGLALAEGLLREHDARLTLIRPGGLPAQERWDALLDDPATDGALRGAMATACRLRALGGEVFIQDAEVTHQAQIEAALAAAHARFGWIDGVLHCEGESTAVPITSKAEADVDEVLAAKIHGTRMLGRAAMARGVGFLMLLSSTDAVVGRAGLADQLGADAFLDAYAAAHRDSKTRVLSINWGAWAEPAPAGRKDARGGASWEIGPSEAIEALGRALAGPALPQLWISSLDYGTSRTRALRSHTQLAAALGEAASTRRDAPGDDFKYLVAMHRGTPGERTPFFLIAGMFGNVLNLRQLANLLGTDRPFYGVQARGLFGGEEPHDNFEDMVRDYLVEIRKVQPRGPYLLGGFSGGGIVAYEMARTLEAQGQEVALLVQIDSRLPQTPALSAMDRAEIQVQRLKRQGPSYIGVWGRERAKWELGKLQERFVDGGSDRRSEDQFHNEAIRAAFVHACEVYEMKPYGGHLTLLRPAPDRHYVLHDGRVLDAARQWVWHDNGWGKWVASMDVFEMPGGHDSMVLEPNVRVMVARLRQCIAAVER